MAKKNILVLAFDRLGADRLKVYGGKIEAPNTIALAKKGTLYRNYIACAGSTAMNFIGMFSGLYPHQTGIRLFDEKEYSPLKDMKETNRGNLLFPCLEDMGYDAYFLSVYRWTKGLEERRKYSREYYKVKSWESQRTKFLTLEHKDSATKNYNQLKSIIEQAKEPWFIFAFFPARTSGEFVGLSAQSTKISCDDYIYDADNLLGMMMDLLGDTATIYFTGDHGYLHGEHGEIDYAMPLCRAVSWTPLISSEGGGREVNDNISNTNFKRVVLGESLRDDKYIYSFNLYSHQQTRRVAIQKGPWRYICHSRRWGPRGREELYDLETDPGERCNLLRKRSASHSDFRWRRGLKWRESLHRTDWEEIERVHLELRKRSKEAWQTIPNLRIYEQKKADELHMGKVRHKKRAILRKKVRKRFSNLVVRARNFEQRFKG